MHLFSLLRGATWYYNAIYILLTYIASFMGYEDNIFDFISYLHVQGAKFGGKKDKFGGKKDKFGGKIFLKVNSVEFMEFPSLTLYYGHLSGSSLCCISWFSMNLMLLSMFVLNLMSQIDLKSRPSNFDNMALIWLG